jgi:hypothetical protein
VLGGIKRIAMEQTVRPETADDIAAIRGALVAPPPASGGMAAAAG